MDQPRDHPRPEEEPLERQFPTCRCASGQEPEWFCKYCRKSFCRQCVGFREVRGERLAECPECRRELIELAIRHPIADTPPAFLPQLLMSPLYPFGKGARVGFVASAVLFTAVWGFALVSLKFVKELAVLLSIFVLVLAIAFYLLYLVRIIEDTAFDRRAHAWPEFNNVLESLVMPLITVAMVAAGCFLPAIVYALAEKVSLYNWSADGVFMGLLALGIFFMPMALLSTALFKTITAMRPVFLLKSVLTVPLRYAAACVLPLGFFWLAVRGVPYVSEIPPTHDLPFYIIAAVYLSMVEARIIGLVYLTGRRRLRWFEKTQPSSGEVTGG